MSGAIHAKRPVFMPFLGFQFIKSQSLF